MTRSGSGISAIFASTAPSPSPLPFRSWTVSLNTARSSAVSPADALRVVLLADFCVSFIAGLLSGLLACQLGDLDHVPAGVVQLGDGRAGHLGARHSEVGAPRLDPLVVGLDVDREEHDGGLALLEEGPAGRPWL